MSDATPKRMSRSAITASVVRLLARLTPYLESELLGLSMIVGQGDVCIDVGAAAGMYTLELSELVGSIGRVISVEPLSNAERMWSPVLRAKEQRNVTHYGVALGIEPGRSVMSVPLRRFGPVTGRSFLASQASGLGSNSEFARHMTVDTEVDTLDRICAKEKLTRLDFIKIDVEGAELQVLQGGRDSIERFKPTLLLEIEDRHLTRFGHKPDDVATWLMKFGYTMHAWHNGWREVDRVNDSSRNYLFRAQTAEQ